MRGIRFIHWVLVSLFLSVAAVLFIGFPEIILADSSSVEYEPLPQGVLVRGSYGVLRVEFCGPRVVRVTASPDGVLPEQESLVVTSPCDYRGFRLKAKGGEVSLRTSALEIRVEPANGRVSFFDIDGSLILAEDSVPREFSRVEIAGDSGYAMGLSFLSSLGENYYGLGQAREGQMRLNSRSLVLEQKNTQTAIPFFVSSKGFGILVDNYSRMKFDSDDHSVNLECALGDALDYYFFYGPSLDQVIAGYRMMTGPAPMFPRWAYGLFQSKCIYSTSRKIKRVVNQYREREIPMDVIVQDFFSSAPLYAWGSHKFDPIRWPDPAGYVSRVHAQNVRVMISVWPNFEKGSRNFRDMKEAGYLFDQKGFGGRYYDPYNPGARKLYWEQIRDQLLVHGYDALWLDATEPEAWSDQNQTYLGSSARYFNAYSLMTTRGVYEGWRKDCPDRRLFILTRSAFAGQQRNAAASWSGDIFNTFDELKLQIPSGLNFCLAGVPYWTTDIGGFYPKPGSPAMTRPEVFVRWFEYGTFCPIFRVHGARPDNELWSYGKDAEQILVDYDRFRYRLLPYIYSQAWKVTSQGYTLMRGLVMDFPEDQQAADIPDQFMFGPAFMVCPVTEEGADSRNVYLPANSDWYDFYTGECLKGGQVILAQAPLSRIPLYVRAGSIIPLGPVVQHTEELPSDTIELRVYPGADGDFTIYDDDGLSYAYEQGQFSLITVHWNDENKTIRIGTREGSFPGMQKEMLFKIVCVRPGHGIGHDPTAAPEKELRYKGKAIEVSCP